VVPAPFIVVVDANVLFPLMLRDTMLRAAAADFYQLRWSEEILDESGALARDDGEVLSRGSGDWLRAARRGDANSLLAKVEAIGGSSLLCMHR
jgi:hypothetical protein